MAGEDRFLLKDLIDPPSVSAIFDAVAAIEPKFDVVAALEEVFSPAFENLELKQRIRHVARVLRSGLPGTYREAIDILVRSVPGVDGAGFAAMALNDVVEEYGSEDFEGSVPALATFTRLASAEFAVRPFLRTHQKQMLAVMEQWAADDDPALRRLASEGSRPRLPWGMGVPALKQDPALTRVILDELRHDPSEDVRRSVANHLNDISKDHPDYVVQVLDDWQDGSERVSEIANHALRTLLKQGHPDALRLLGFRPGVDVLVRDLRLDPDSVVVGSSARAHWELVNRDTASHRVMVDYRVSYHRAGKQPSTKVFKGAIVELRAGETREQHRKLSFAQMSTRRVEPGPHSIEVQVNGEVGARCTFDVVAD